MKAYKIMLFLMAIDISAIYVNTMGIFPNSITVNASALPSIVIPSLIGILISAAGLSILMKDSLMGAVYGAFAGIYWATYITAIVTVRQMLPQGVLLLFSPIYAIVFVAALLQLNTGGWEYDV